MGLPGCSGYMMELKKISDIEWEIPVEGGHRSVDPKTQSSGVMNVPARIFASEELLKSIKGDKSLEQVKNVAKLPGILKASYAMPDMHQGYGFPIGGVAAFDMDSGIVSPGGVGYDINCGVRLLATDLSIEDFVAKTKDVLHDFKRTIPSGVGRGHKEKLSVEDLKEILVEGAEWAVKKGMGTKEDLERTEEGGRMSVANPEDVSERAVRRGMPQSGTLGAGNHFIEIQKVEDIYDEDVAKVFGLKKGQIVVMIHCGSRGLGHQVASDYIKKLENELGVEDLPDRELISAPIKSELGQKYLSAMSCAVNFAFCNRQIIMNYVREVLERHFPGVKTSLVYDVAHNIAKIEKHDVDGKMKEVCIHRKGATRAFGPGRDELPSVYQKSGQPVIIPGSMGTASYVLVGTDESMKLAWGSAAHGAGRRMSRSKAVRELDGNEVKKDLNKKGIEVEAGSIKGLAEEAPDAYKDVDEVVRVTSEAGLARPVVKVVPIGVMKG